MTVNKALSQLAKAGLIERRRRSGSFVRRPQSQAAVLEIHDIKVEVQALGLPYSYTLISREQRRSTAQDREALGLEQTTTQLLDLTCLHRAGARAFCLEERLISLEAVPGAAEERFEHTAPGPWLVGHVPWSTAEHRIRATAASAEIATLLELAPGAACLVVERRTWSADRPVTQVRFTYAGDNHVLVARFTPSGGN
jgi:GntR family histidine utilization transcriptional repressor